MSDLHSFSRITKDKAQVYELHL